MITSAGRGEPVEWRCLRYLVAAPKWGPPPDSPRPFISDLKSPGTAGRFENRCVSKWEVLGNSGKSGQTAQTAVQGSSIRFSKSVLYPYGPRCAHLLKARSANHEFSVCHRSRYSETCARRKQYLGKHRPHLRTSTATNPPSRYSAAFSDGLGRIVCCVTRRKRSLPFRNESTTASFSSGQTLQVA
jgi:hypothetical protein